MKAIDWTKAVRAAFICDGGYVMQTAVAIRSLLDARETERPVEIYVIDAGLDESAYALFNRFASEDVRVVFRRGELRPPAFAAQSADKRYLTATRSALLKFSLPELLGELDRVLYLDGDIVVRGDLAPLFDTPLDGCPLGAVRDLPQVFYERRLLGDSRDYFNSGVLLMDLDALRAEEATEELWRAKAEIENDPLMDQNAFNRVFAGRVRQLSWVYNVCYANLHRRWRRERMAHKLSEAYGHRVSSLRQLRDESVILHFSSKEKPWRYFDIPAGDEWLRCYERAGFSRSALRRGCWALREWKSKLRRLMERTGLARSHRSA